MDAMFVNLIAASGNGDTYTSSYGGGISRQATDDDLLLFNLTDSSVKTAVGKIKGQDPNNVFAHDPTPWGDKGGDFKKYGWTPVTLTLTPVSVTVTPDGPPISTAIATKTITNQLSYPVDAQASFDTSVQNTAETNWSQTSTLTVSEEVSFSLRFFGSSTTVSFAQEWQKGGSQSQSVTIGSSTTITFPVPPGKSIEVQNLAFIGKATAKIVYQAYLTGGYFIDYKKGYKGHHYYHIPVFSILSAMGVANNVSIVQDVKITSYMYDHTAVVPLNSAANNAFVVGEKNVLGWNPAIYLPADWVPESDEAKEGLIIETKVLV